jgi:hypothetical protein
VKKVQILSANRLKFDTRRSSGVTMGYEPTKKEYRIWNPHTRQIVVSRDVHFVHKTEEDKNLGGENVTVDGVSPGEKSSLDFFIDFEMEAFGGEMNVESPPPKSTVDLTSNATGESTRINVTGGETLVGKIMPGVPDDADETQNQQPALRRVPRLSRRLIEAYRHIATVDAPLDFRATIESVDSDNKWQEATQSKIDSSVNHNIWKLVGRSNNKDVSGCKWVSNLKNKCDGSFESFTARKVAEGYSQKRGGK